MIWLLETTKKVLINMSARLSNAANEINYLIYELKFGERDDDIYVATYLKSGTTWMQMILYQMTTDGNMDFNHIYDVSPWLRNLAYVKKDIPDVPSPRIIKTHDPYDKIPGGKKGRFIFVLRDGLDVANSLYHHRKNYNNYNITPEESFKTSFVEEDQMNWFLFVRKWIENKNRHNILIIKYEDLMHDFDNQVTIIAKFINIDLSDETLARVKDRASFSFMKQYQNKFGEQPPEDMQRKVYDQFIRKGKVGEGKLALPDEQKEFYKKKLVENFGKLKLMKDYIVDTISE